MEGGGFRDFTLSHDHSLHISFLGSDFEIAVDDTNQVVRCDFPVRIENTYVTANKIPVPDPRAPIKSLATERAPMHAPPKAAAVGMMRFNSLYMLCSL